MRVLITGGGTGGHLFPGIALAKGLQQRVAGCTIMFVGTGRQLDRDTLAGSGFQQYALSCMGLKGKGLLHRLKSLARLPAAVLEARRTIQQFGPDLVFGVGGYVTGPVLLAAKLLKIPTCIHEQNSIPGLANRMISRFVDTIFVSIPGDYPFPAAKIEVTGNPVRSEIIAAAERGEGKGGQGNRLLVLGGSQGAHRVNRLMLEAALILKKEYKVHVDLIHQTGAADEEMVRQGYEEAGIEAEVAPFFQDMASRYQQADLVVSRAGATTLAELSVMGLPALLIPYPHAADDHQARNGDYYVRGGGARMYRESELDGRLLAAAVTELLQSPGELPNMSSKMKKMGRPDAARLIVDRCLQIIGDSVTAG